MLSKMRLKQMSIDRGELVYVPSEVALYTYDSNLNISDYSVLREPKNLLVTESKKFELGVYFRGMTWYVKKRDVYKLEVS